LIDEPDTVVVSDVSSEIVGRIDPVWVNKFQVDTGCPMLNEDKEDRYNVNFGFTGADEVG
jgi:hypothetical protein